MVSEVSRPHSTSHGIGHQAGGGPPVSWVGRSVNRYFCNQLTNARKPYATAEIGTPRMAAMIRAVMYGRDRITAIGSTPGGPPDGVGSGRVAGVPADPAGSCELVISYASSDEIGDGCGPVIDGARRCARAEPTAPRQHGCGAANAVNIAAHGSSARHPGGARR